MEDGDQVTVGQCRPLSKTVRDKMQIPMLEAMAAIRTSQWLQITNGFLQRRSVSTFFVCSRVPARPSSRLPNSRRVVSGGGIYL